MTTIEREVERRIERKVEERKYKEEKEEAKLGLFPSAEVFFFFGRNKSQQMKSSN